MTVETPGSSEEEVVPSSEERAEDLSEATEKAVDDLDDTITELEVKGVNDDAPEVTEEELSAEDKAKEEQVWDAIKNLDISSLFGSLTETFDRIMMDRLGMDEEQWTKTFEFLPGMAGFRESVSKGYVETDENLQTDTERLWPKASHFTFGPNVNPVITSNPQADRGNVRNKEGKIVSRGAHKGVDISVPIGTPLALTQPGRVVRTNLNRAKGLSVAIEYPDGTVASFGHLDAIHVKVGDQLRPDQVFAKTGNTGRSTGPHLHLQTYKGDQLIDPFGLLKGTGMEPKGGFQNYKFPWGETYHPDEEDDHDHAAHA